MTEPESTAAGWFGWASRVWFPPRAPEVPADYDDFAALPLSVSQEEPNP